MYNVYLRDRRTLSACTHSFVINVESIDVKDGERLVKNNMNIFIVDDESVEDNEADSNIGDDTVDSSQEDIFEDIVTEEE